VSRLIDQKQDFSISETAAVLDQPERRIRGWVDEGLVAVREYKAPRDKRPERFVSRRGLVKLGLVAYLGRHLGERAPIIRQIVQAIPEDVTGALDSVDLEIDTPQEIRLTLGDGSHVTIGTGLLRALVAKIRAEGLAV
jgi:hypothetical protein